MCIRDRGGDLGVEFSTKLNVAVQLDSKVTCKLQLFQKNLPLPGPIGFLLGVQIPFGVGGEIGGKITVADTGYELKAKLAAHVEGALVCNLGSCGSLEGGVQRQTDPITGKKVDYVTWDAKINLLGTDTLTANLRFEPSVSGFDYMEIKFGNPLFSNLQLSMVEARLGPTQQASLALVDSQIVSPDYKSDYKLTYDLKLSLGNDINKAMKLFKKGALPFSVPSFSIGTDVSASPTSLAVTSDVSTFTTGDAVNFTVKLDPVSVNYLHFFYNVDEVIIYRRTSNGTLDRIASATAADGQTDFTIPWTADSAGSASNLYAFVKTRLSLLPNALAELELGKVKGQSSNGKIAFVSNRDGNKEIYVMNADGSNLLNLTNDPLDDRTPAWSPDGSKIAFVRLKVINHISSNELYVMNADGSNPVKLTNNLNSESAVIWSPDGTRIVFREHDGGLYVTNTDGSNLFKLDNSRSSTYSPSWSPDGAQIVYMGIQNPGRGIYVINADGSNLVELTVNPFYDYSPAWSPDGSKIAFGRRLRTGIGTYVQEIYVMNADGSNPVNLTNNPGNDGDLIWSPDGSKIAFVSTRDGGNGEIYVMNADGTSPVKLTNDPGAYDSGAAWSPDGSKIAFISARVGNGKIGNSEIYVMDADGSNQVNLTNDPGSDSSPVWSPR